MLASAYTLKNDGHVRVDVFHRRFSPRLRAWVELLGGLFLLLPVTIFILVSSWGYVLESWRLLEGSREPGGIPLVFLLKSLIPLMALTLTGQGCSAMIRSILLLTGHPSSQSPEEVAPGV